MKSIYIEDIQEENIQGILDDINSDKEIVIHNDSNWWNTTLFDMVAKTLNAKVEKWDKIKMVVHSVASNWFNLALRFNWDIEVGIVWEAILHTNAIGCSVFTNKVWELKIRASDEILHQRLKDLQPNQYDFLSKEEQEKIDDWKDVYIKRDRLIEIFKKDTP